MFNKYILEPFLEVVESFDKNNAFCIGDEFYAYGTFAKHISKIRSALRLSNYGSRNIGIIANDDIETYASIFAIWFEGLAYVPLHPSQPRARNLEIINQANIDVVISSNEIDRMSNAQIIISSSLVFAELQLKPKHTSDDDLAYILFTSGSTGKPKGVPITRGNLAAFFESFLEVGFDITASDRCLQCFDLTFDVSVQSFLVPLVNGACVFTVPHNQIKYSYVFGLLEDHRVTFSIMAPSMLRFFRPYFDEMNFLSLRYSILTAEASPVDLVEEWSKCVPNAQIYNFYGPTEATIYCTYYEFKRRNNNIHVNGMLTIGKTMNGIRAVIIDEEANIIKTNQRGELCISGRQLSKGYWNNPDKTVESFFNLQHHGVESRFYKTGDLCYREIDGDIMYVGRIDYQVKIQGYRIELGEIEYHAREYLGGQNAIAISFENEKANIEIALFIEGDLDDPTNILEYLKSKIPNYMIPSKVLVEEKFPLNTNDKVDRNVLRNIITQ